MQFEVAVYRNEVGEWVVTAIEHAVTVKGRTEQEALAMMMNALNEHFKKST